MILLLLLLCTTSSYSIIDEIILSPTNNYVNFQGQQCDLGALTKQSFPTFTRPVIICIFYKTFYCKNQLYKKTYLVKGIQQRPSLKDIFKPKSKRPTTLRIHEIKTITSVLFNPGY